MRINYFLFITAVTLGSCSPYQRLTTDFTTGKNSLSYLYSSPKQTSAMERPTVGLALPVINTKFGPGEVKKIKGTVIPLILVNTWNYDYECELGKNQIKENVQDFISESLREESKRSGKFILKSPSASLTNYSLEILVDSLSSRGPYNSSGHIIFGGFFYSHHKRERAGPGRAFCSYHYQLKNGSDVVSEGYVQSEKSIEMLTPKKGSFSEFHGYYRSNLTESLSEVIKMNNEKLINKLNSLF